MGAVPCISSSNSSSNFSANPNVGFRINTSSISLLSYCFSTISDISPFRCWKRWLANRSDSLIFTRTYRSFFSKIILSYITGMSVLFSNITATLCHTILYSYFSDNNKDHGCRIRCNQRQKTSSGRIWISIEHLCPLWSTVLSKEPCINAGSDKNPKPICCMFGTQGWSWTKTSC